MPQKIYDDAEFLNAYRELKQNGTKHGLIGGSMSLEQLAAALPPLAGLKVLDLGCGDGWFSMWAISQGVASVHGIDVSESQLALARETAKAIGASDQTMWECADFDSATLSENTYDLVFSSLALHYAKNPRAIIAKIAASLKSAGSVYFSVEHPIFTASSRRTMCRGSDGNSLHWPIAQYFQEGDRTHFWLGKNVEKSHFTLETYLNAVLSANLTLVHFHEWTRPNNGEFKGRKWWMSADMGPSYLFLGAKKSAGE